MRAKALAIVQHLKRIWYDNPTVVPFIPVEQSIVHLFDHPVHAVRLEDGRIAAVFTDLCQALGLDRAGQAKRIRADEVLCEQMLFCMIEVGDAGQQPMDVLTAWAIPTWLHGIQLSRLAPEKRPAILAFKREAADILYRHFSERRMALLEPAAIVPAEPIAEPEPPDLDASEDEQIAYHQTMIAMLLWRKSVQQRLAESDQRQLALEQRQDALEDRMESVEEVTRLLPEIIERLGPQTLTTEHQATVKAMVARLHDLAGIAFGAIYADLNIAFHVARYADIPDARWPEVAEWFQKRIVAAEKRRVR